MRRLIRQDRHETRQGVGRDVAEQERGGHPSIEPGPGKEDGEQPPARIDQERPLAPVALLPPVIAALRATQRGGLDRLALAADGARRGRVPRWHTGWLTPYLAHVCPGPVSAPPGKGGRDGACGQQSVGPPLPWAATPIERAQRLASLPPGPRTRASSPVARLGGWEHRCQERPWLVRQISRILLAMPYAVHQSGARLCSWDMRSLSNKSTLVPTPVSG